MSKIRVPKSGLDSVAAKQSRAKGPGVSNRELKKFTRGSSKGVGHYGVSKADDIPIVSFDKLKF